MSQHFYPRLSEAIGSKTLSLDQLINTPSTSNFQHFAAGVFLSHISYFWRKIAKNLYYSSENLGFPYLNSPHMTFIEPNMDKGCRIFQRFNRNSSQDFFRLMNCIVSCKFVMIKNLNYLTIKPGVSLSSMRCH